MDHRYENILSPVGVVGAHVAKSTAVQRDSAGRRVIGLINNSKPNVAFFLDTITEELRRSGDYEIVSVTKPRSAGPSPDLDTLAASCDFVVNAVAD